MVQGGSFNSDLSSPTREVSSTDSVLDDVQSRLRRLERWNTINMVISLYFQMLFKTHILSQALRFNSVCMRWHNVRLNN